jgi:hypothetical protein
MELGTTVLLTRRVQKRTWESLLNVVSMYYYFAILLIRRDGIISRTALTRSIKDGTLSAGIAR